MGTRGIAATARVTHFVPVTLCVTRKPRLIQWAYGVIHNVTGTKCVTTPVCGGAMLGNP